MNGIRVALTCDDAPTVLAGEHGLDADASRLDTVCAELVEHGVGSCVAFVIGLAAVGQESRLRRWLHAGFELGNHTFDHRRASAVGVDAFLDSVTRCDELLRGIGAFDGGRPRYFRYPYLDRGRPQEGREIRDRLRDLGYQGAPASVDFFDYCYEVPLREALANSSAAQARRIESRYVVTAVRSLRYVDGLTKRSVGNVAQVPFFHFGQVSSRCLGELLDRLSGVQWVGLSEALDHRWYQSQDEDPGQSGLVSGNLMPRSLLAKARRKLVALSVDRHWFGQRRTGPRWPYLG